MATGDLHRFTVKEYYRMAEIGVFQPDARVELIDGIVVDKSPISPLHGGVVTRLNRYFQCNSKDRWMVRVQNPVHMGEHSEPEPDLVLVKPTADDYCSRHPNPEDVFLLIEVSDSTLETDREDKLPLYGRAGIAEVWIVNLVGATFEVYRDPHFSGYSSTQILREGDSVAPSQFPDAVVEVSKILRR